MSIGFAEALLTLDVLLCAAAALSGRLPRRRHHAEVRGVYALGLAFVAFGLADVTYGRCPIFQIASFFVFGALVVATGWSGPAWPLAAFTLLALLVARPAAGSRSLHRRADAGAQQGLRRMVRTERWRLDALCAPGPQLDRSADRTMVFDVASFVILASIFAPGLTDTVGAGWLERLAADSVRDSRT